jgi:hypothetical protein
MAMYEDNLLPIGFGMALAMNLDAMNHFSNLSESEKEEILNRARDAKSKDEMQHIVSELSPDSFF